ncbi:precorrin-2 C(20)-methyltransferase [Dethiosulfatarculus sandiegensis]|uniref:Precorrin-2 C20-methyltransferase n=1 Tax=Dethiosulfatarculus sandiegensis TaxID=1429043 RepID=A0A0D2HNK2_9BACT|nr:precorrin-2 C(20)-methyltransferase [Dethiosulfatarculus sandiegensis]KIX12148.1 precorrin-2 C20-methyltransferase [Dethiosulfatarculus sandiegensis]
MTQTKGTLYGLGMGPGDPKLVTVRAVEILKQVDTVFAASSPKNGYSLALNTALPYLPEETKVVRLKFPMTKDKEVLEKAWQENALAVLEVLQKGKDAAFITIGDCLTYSTYGYLIKTIEKNDPGITFESVPGITAYAAAASRLNLPLVEHKESLLVVSGVSDPKEIPELAECGDNLVIMKAYRSFEGIMDALESLPEKRDISLVSNCCLEDERLVPDAREVRGEKMPYLSLLIAKKPEE